MLSKVYELTNSAIDLSNKIFGNFLEKSDIILITGGCSGLGKEIVLQLLNRGYPHIIVFDINIKNKLKFNDVHYYECDVSDFYEIAKIQDQIKLDVGIVTCIINNAGIMIGKPLIEMTNVEIDKLININLVSNFYINKLFLPDMIKIRKGYIITIASVLGYMSPANLTVYGASKSGLIAMHEVLTNELSFNSNNIKTLLICSGQLKTEMFKDVKTPSNILAPEIQPSYLASKIIEFCEVGKRGDYKIPLYGNFLPIFRSLPWPVTKIARIISGMDHTMNEYANRLI